MASLWKRDDPLLLASSSKTRLHLLQTLMIPVEARAADIDERAIEADLVRRNAPPREIALELARAKGAAVSRKCPERLVVAADQTLALGDLQFHKPRSTEEARAQLRQLSARTHELHAGVACFANGECVFAHIESAQLTMRELSEASLTDFLEAAGDAVLQSVGGYQVEGLGAHLFEAIHGDHSTILGLPLLPLLRYLRSVGALAA